jgi:hypothetical protein
MKESDVPIYFIILDVPVEKKCPGRIRDGKKPHLRYFAKGFKKIRQLLIGARK